MIDITGSIAKHTVTFERELTGAQIIAAVKAACERSGDTYHEEKEYDDGWRVTAGRASAHLDRSLVVAGDKVTPYLEPDKSYPSAVIAYHHLPDGNEIRIQNFSIENVVASIQEFEYDLKLAIDTDLGHAQELGSREAAVVIEDSATRQEVRFDRPTTGRDLMAAVRESCTDNGYDTRYYESAQPGGSRYVVGQSSGLAYRSLVVVPDSGDGSIDPNRTYTGATVATHHLQVPGQQRYPVRSTAEQEAGAVGKFAQVLQQNVRQQQAAAVGLDRGAVPREAVRVDTTAGEADRRTGTPRPGGNLSRG